MEVDLAVAVLAEVDLVVVLAEVDSVVVVVLEEVDSVVLDVDDDSVYGRCAMSFMFQIL